MSLDLDHLQRAIAALEAAIERACDDDLMGSLDEVAQNVMMSGVVQHFEFTYEICRVHIERWLRTNYGAEVRGVSRKEMYRFAGQYDLIDGVERWFAYHVERNRTSHRYDEELLKVLDETIPSFIEDAKELLRTLEAQDA